MRGGVHRGEDVANAFAQKENDDQAHGNGEDGVNTSGGLNAASVEIGGEQREADHPKPVGDAGHDVPGSLTAPDDADDGIEEIVHQHGPSNDVTKFGIEFLGDVGESRPGAGICPRHAPIADRREQHRDHCDQDGSDDVTLATLA